MSEFNDNNKNVIWLTHLVMIICPCPKIINLSFKNQSRMLTFKSNDVLLGADTSERDYIFYYT